MTTGTDMPPALTASDERFLSELAQQLRADSIRCSTAAGSGHPTPAMSAADVMAVLLARYLRYDWDSPGEPGSDHLVFSKGRASPLLYAIFKAAGAITDEELVTGFCRFGSRLQGHPTPAIPWVDVATGSPGQGLPHGVGIALAGRRLDKLPYQVWVLCGDSESSRLIWRPWPARLRHPGPADGSSRHLRVPDRRRPRTDQGRRKRGNQ